VALAASAYAVATGIVVVFQLALALGAPWGERAMGGRWSGTLPPAARVGAVVQAIVLALLALVVLDAAGVLDLGWTDALPWLPWVPVAVASLSAVMNAATRSPAERRTWLPVALVLLASSLIVAIA
jgi:hypothetical protein